MKMKTKSVIRKKENVQEANLDTLSANAKAAGDMILADNLSPNFKVIILDYNAVENEIEYIINDKDKNSIKNLDGSIAMILLFTRIVTGKINIEQNILRVQNIRSNDEKSELIEDINNIIKYGKKYTCTLRILPEVIKAIPDTYYLEKLEELIRGTTRKQAINADIELAESERLSNILESEGYKLVTKKGIPETKVNKRIAFIGADIKITKAVDDGRVTLSVSNVAQIKSFTSNFLRNIFRLDLETVDTKFVRKTNCFEIENKILKDISFDKAVRDAAMAFEGLLESTDKTKRSKSKREGGMSKDVFVHFTDNQDRIIFAGRAELVINGKGSNKSVLLLELEMKDAVREYKEPQGFLLTGGSLGSVELTFVDREVSSI